MNFKENLLKQILDFVGPNSEALLSQIENDLDTAELSIVSQRLEELQKKNASRKFELTWIKSENMEVSVRTNHPDDKGVTNDSSIYLDFRRQLMDLGLYSQ